MKILHVLETMSRRYGGPVSVLKSLARTQLAQGHEVTIATTGGGDADDAELARFFASGPAPSIAKFPLNFRPLAFSFDLLRALPKLVAASDVVHIHGLYRFPPTYAATTARRLRKPYIIRPFGSLDPFMYAQSSTSLRLKRLYEKLFDLPNLHAASAIHFTTEEERQRAGYLHLKAASFVLPNGLDWRDYETLPETGKFRARLGISTDTPLLLFLGRINFKKGLDLLVPAFAAIRRAHPASRLAIVGPDNEGYGAKVRQMIEEHRLADAVDMLDMLTGGEVLEAYSDADLFLLPSYTENFGMTVIEAMACSTPVLISDQVNIHREVHASGGGVVTPCDPARIAEAASALLDQPDRRRFMGESGRAWVSKNFAWPAIVQQLQLEYLAAIDRHKFKAG